MTLMTLSLNNKKMISQSLLNDLKLMSFETRKKFLKDMTDHDFIELCSTLGFAKSTKKSINQYFELMSSL